MKRRRNERGTTMNMVTVKVMRTAILAVGLLGTAAVGTARAQDQMTETKRTAGGMKEEHQRKVMGTVEKIDKDKREVTLADDQGNKKTVQVPESMKGFDQLKVGDRVNATVTESLAVGMGKPGEKPSTVTREGQMGGGGTERAAMRQVEATVEVANVNTKKHEVTFKKPDGTTDTVTVDDPQLREKLNTIKPGDTIEMVYTQAVAGTITPAKKK